MPRDAQQIEDTRPPCAWQFRYPEEPSAPSVQEAKEALALAREVYETILGRLPEEVRP